MYDVYICSYIFPHLVYWWGVDVGPSADDPEQQKWLGVDARLTWPTLDLWCWLEMYFNILITINKYIYIYMYVKKELTINEVVKGVIILRCSPRTMKLNMFVDIV